MNWLLVLLAWALGRWSSRDLTTYAPPPAASPPPAPRPTRPTASWPAPSPGPMPRPTPTTVPASTAPTPAAPWPQAVPPGLPPWPTGWEPDEPVGAGVAARAAALLPQLWAHGEGTRKTEQTNGRWITYVARSMGSKRGVVAFRPKPGASAAPPPTTPAAAITEAIRAGARTLRRGDSGADVTALQLRLGVTADGKFGPQTEGAVRTYQSTHGLSADGVVGPKTWASLLSIAA